MQSRWAPFIAATVGLLLIAACGRVDLDDLTPEAVKTQQAAAAVTATAQAAEQDALGNEFTGDPQAGKIKYDVWCTGCHDGTIAEPIRGEAYPFSEWEEFFRTGGDIDHPSYDPVLEVSDGDFVDILTYVATAD